LQKTDRGPSGSDTEALPKDPLTGSVPWTPEAPNSRTAGTHSIVNSRIRMV